MTKKLKNLIVKVAKNLEFLKAKIKKGEIQSVLLYGSYVSGEETARSDIDVCVVAPKYKTIKHKAALLRYIWQNLKKPYDVRLFEELPLYIKMGIINNHKVIYARDISELSHYFYFYRKLWQDQAIHRIEIER